MSIFREFRARTYREPDGLTFGNLVLPTELSKRTARRNKVIRRNPRNLSKKCRFMDNPSGRALIEWWVRRCGGKRRCRSIVATTNRDTAGLRAGLLLPARTVITVPAMSNPHVVSIRALSKIYRQGEINVTALNEVSLDIAGGEFLTLMGPSGS